MTHLWTFLAYSFLGFLLEVAFARAIGHPKRDRKCFLFLPLCPVYGLGALLILALPGWAAADPLRLWFFGALAATGAEYALGLFYEKALGVAFWDYRGFPGNLRGRVCPLFSALWGVLAVGVRGWLHPRLAPWLAALPAGWALPAVVLLTLDSYATLARLSRTGEVGSLRWYDGLRGAGAPPGSRRASGAGGSPPPEQ